MKRKRDKRGKFLPIYRLPNKIIKEYLKGKIIADLSKENNCSQDTIWKFLKRKGITRLNVHRISRLPKLTEAEKGYIAGIIDGEGYIQKLPGCKCSWRLYVNNTNKEVIQWLYQKIPYSHLGVSSPKRANHKKCYYWSLTKSLATWFLLRQIFPYLIIKKRKVKRELREYQEGFAGFDFFL